MSDLPIHAVLPDLLARLRGASNAVLVAPPGAGKTTAVAPALLAEPWCDGEILLLSPAASPRALRRNAWRRWPGRRWARPSDTRRGWTRGGRLRRGSRS
ncbi:hypothetical protein [Sphingomonas sp. J315]|uniref:hypothetical protein n=1 Tax=Sphingomonas sp. J315 TaxID=2898433 RepID=UPI003916F860